VGDDHPIQLRTKKTSKSPGLLPAYWWWPTRLVKTVYNVCALACIIEKELENRKWKRRKTFQTHLSSYHSEIFLGNSTQHAHRARLVWWHTSVVYMDSVGTLVYRDTYTYTRQRKLDTKESTSKVRPTRCQPAWCLRTPGPQTNARWWGMGGGKQRFWGGVLKEGTIKTLMYTRQGVSGLSVCGCGKNEIRLHV